MASFPVFIAIFPPKSNVSSSLTKSIQTTSSIKSFCAPWPWPEPLSCPPASAPKEVLYIQDVSGNSRETIKANYQTTIQKDDQLYIAVSSKQPELTAPFAMSEIGSSSGTSSNKPKGYLVDAQGCIVLPVIGKMKAAGKTCSQLASDIAATLRTMTTSGMPPSMFRS